MPTSTQLNLNRINKNFKIKRIKFKEKFQDA